MDQAIYYHGIELIKSDIISSKRLYINLGENNDGDEENNIIEKAIRIISNKISINLLEYKNEIIYRNNPEGFYLNWHIDDCAVYKHNTTMNKTNNILLNDKYSLYHKKELPKFTMIIYLTSIDEDFKGGEFEFVNQLIRPKKNDVIFFDSREVHRVRRFRGGERKNILIKFYEK